MTLEYIIKKKNFFFSFKSLKDIIKLVFNKESAVLSI